jgi:hypothetical protein
VGGIQALFATLLNKARRLQSFSDDSHCQVSFAIS